MIHNEQILRLLYQKIYLIMVFIVFNKFENDFCINIINVINAIVITVYIILITEFIIC